MGAGARSNDDSRNRERYELYNEECGICRIFRSPDGIVVRHQKRSFDSNIWGKARGRGQSKRPLKFALMHMLRRDEQQKTYLLGGPE